MELDPDSLKNHLNKFADESILIFIKEIGNLADKSLSADDFVSRLDQLCKKTIGKTSSELLAERSLRLPDPRNPRSATKERKTENNSLQNELIEVKGKVNELIDRLNSRQTESES